MKPSNSKPATAAPTKRPARPAPFNLTFARLAGLEPEPAATTTPKRAAPAVATTTKRPAPAPVAIVHDFSHLARVRHVGPIYTPPAAAAAAAPVPDRAGIVARLNENMQAALPLRQQRRP